MAHILQPVVADLLTLVQDADLRQLLAKESPHPEHEHRQYFIEAMESLALYREVYDQIRYIDETGMEQIRVNYDHRQVSLTPTPALQNKRGRYYFDKTMALEPGEIYVSPLDLNIEQGRIEVPHKPVIRIATPLYDGEKRQRGLIILNYRAQKLLSMLESDKRQGNSTIWLVNPEGYWLKGPAPEKEW